MNLTDAAQYQPLIDSILDGSANLADTPKVQAVVILLGNYLADVQNVITGLMNSDKVQEAILSGEQKSVGDAKAEAVQAIQEELVITK